MNKYDLLTELNKLGLILKPYSDEQWTVGSSEFANIMMGFNPRLSEDDYSGGVTFKVINAGLFTGDQIKGASKIVNRFLMTPLERR
ncbi:hypothetical protein ABE073_04870 [Lederbergia citrisecunda]|uniref:hypothetical protein n=1 Tax=Lederbergia citrisecunda TaxID=2833583 RepID=UPI003D2BB2F3